MNQSNGGSGSIVSPSAQHQHQHQQLQFQHLQQLQQAQYQQRLQHHYLAAAAAATASPSPSPSASAPAAALPQSSQPTTMPQGTAPSPVPSHQPPSNSSVSPAATTQLRAAPQGQPQTQPQPQRSRQPLQVAPAAPRKDTKVIRRRLESVLGSRIDDYMAILSMFLRARISKAELDPMLTELLGRENVALHNDLIMTILHNARSNELPPMNIPIDVAVAIHSVLSNNPWPAPAPQIPPLDAIVQSSTLPLPAPYPLSPRATPRRRVVPPPPYANIRVTFKPRSAGAVSNPNFPPTAMAAYAKARRIARFAPSRSMSAGIDLPKEAAEREARDGPDGAPPTPMDRATTIELGLRKNRPPSRTSMNAPTKKQNAKAQTAAARAASTVSRAKPNEDDSKDRRTKQRRSKADDTVNGRGVPSQQLSGNGGGSVGFTLPRGTGLTQQQHQAALAAGLYFDPITQSYQPMPATIGVGPPLPPLPPIPLPMQGQGSKGPQRGGALRPTSGKGVPSKGVPGRSVPGASKGVPSSVAGAVVTPSLPVVAGLGFPIAVPTSGAAATASAPVTIPTSVNSAWRQHQSMSHIVTPQQFAARQRAMALFYGEPRMMIGNLRPSSAPAIAVSPAPSSAAAGAAAAISTSTATAANVSGSGGSADPVPPPVRASSLISDWPAHEPTPTNSFAMPFALDRYSLPDAAYIKHRLIGRARELGISRVTDASVSLVMHGIRAHLQRVVISLANRTRIKHRPPPTANGHNPNSLSLIADPYDSHSANAMSDDVSGEVGIGMGASAASTSEAAAELRAALYARIARRKRRRRDQSPPDPATKVITTADLRAALRNEPYLSCHTPLMLERLVPTL